MMWVFLSGNITSVLLCIAILIAAWIFSLRPSGIPPGPGLSLPIFGHILSVGTDPRKKFREWRKKYGDTFSLYLGNRLVIVMNGFDVMTDAFVKNGDVFSDRPHLFVFDELGKGRGVVSNSGPVWKEQRRFIISTLKDFGMGKSILETAINDECAVFLQEIRDREGGVFDFHPLVHTAVANIIFTILTGKRFGHNDDFFQEWTKRAEEVSRSAGLTAVLNFIPLARYIAGDPFKFKRTMQNVDFFENRLARPSIEEHLKTFDDNYISDFISAYIKEIKLNNNQKTSLGFDNLNQVIIDLFFAGSETTTTTIRWIILLLMKHPDIQEKCFQEIKENIGLRQTLHMSDKLKLPYVEATITEVQRLVNVVPLSLWHSVPSDVTFRGFSFPKGVIILPNLDSVLHDPTVFEEPKEFRPERFLDANGKFVKRAEMIPFFFGKRSCPGKSLAKMELFLFVTALIQRFKFIKPKNEPPLTIDSVPGLTFAPKPFKLTAVSRH